MVVVANLINDADGVVLVDDRHRLTRERHRRVAGVEVRVRLSVARVRKDLPVAATVPATPLRGPHQETLPDGASLKVAPSTERSQAPASQPQRDRPGATRRPRPVWRMRHLSASD
jgi:hypothetical protein